MKYIESGAMIKFEATKDSVMENNEHGLMPGTTDHKFAVTHKWTSVIVY